MLPMILMSSQILSTMSGKKEESAPINGNPIDLQITYKDGERIVTPVEVK